MIFSKLKRERMRVADPRRRFGACFDVPDSRPRDRRFDKRRCAFFRFVRKYFITSSRAANRAGGQTRDSVKRQGRG